jgi:hypothetical protein
MMKTFRLTKLLSVFPVLAVALVAGAAVGVPATVERFAPYSSTTSECLVCGRMQTIEKRWLQDQTSSIYAGEDSLWMQPQVDNEHEHWWVGCSPASRPNWYGDLLFGCGGGIGGVSSLHHLSKSKGHEFSQPYLQNYLQLTKADNLKAVRDFVQEEILPALQDSPITEPIVE